MQFPAGIFLQIRSWQFFYLEKFFHIISTNEIIENGLGKAAKAFARLTILVEFFNLINQHFQMFLAPGTWRSSHLIA